MAEHDPDPVGATTPVGSQGRPPPPAAPGAGDPGERTSEGWWRQLRRPVSAPSAVAAVGWCAFAIYLVVQARLGPALIWNDSRIYASMAQRPLWSRAVWLGARPPLTALVIKAVGSPSSVITAQAVVGAMCWGVLAWTVGRLVDPGWRRVTAIFVILGFASTLPVSLWNRSELSESLSMSLLALVFAGFIWTSRRATWPRVAATTAAGLAFAATRDAQVWTVGMLALAAGIFALARLRASRKTAVRAGVLSVCLLGAVVVAEWGTLASHRTTPDTADVLYARVFPFPDRVAWFAAHGMPEARQIDQRSRETPVPPDAAKMVFISAGDAAFHPLERWMRTDAGGTYLLWLVTHPGYVLGEPLQRPERAFNFAQGELDFYAPTHALPSPLTAVLWPPLLGLTVLSALALYLGIVAEAWRSRPWCMVGVLTLVGVAAMLVAWHGDAQEVTRHTVEGFTQVRLGVWILLTLGVLGRMRPVPRGPARDTGTDRPAPGRSGTPQPPATTPAGSLGPSGAEQPPSP